MFVRLPSVSHGALACNAGRGSIVRRLIRRATLDIDKLGVHDVGSLPDVVGVVEAMGEATEIQRRQDLAPIRLSQKSAVPRALKRGMDLLLARSESAGRGWNSSFWRRRF